MTDLIPHESNLPTEATLEEMRENLLLGITTLLKQSSGIKDEKEFKVLYGRHVSHIGRVLDHIIILASK